MKMSIKTKKPTAEFYSSLDDVINHQIKSRKAFNRAIEIARKQGFGDLEISLFVKDYLKHKIPKTSLYRYIKEIKPVPLERIYYNNVLEQKDPYLYAEWRKNINGMNEAIREEVKLILKMAKVLKESGLAKEKISAKIKEETKLNSEDEGDSEADIKSRLKIVDFALQQTGYKDPNIPEEDYLLESIKYMLRRKHGGYIDDNEFTDQSSEQETS
jgi:hypothetical protein